MDSNVRKTIKAVRKEIKNVGFNREKYNDEFLYDLVSNECDIELFKFWYLLYIDNNVEFNPEVVYMRIGEENDIDAFTEFIQHEEIRGFIKTANLSDEEIKKIMETHGINY